MANSFDISDKPEIAANLVKILSNASALATIQITTLPDIATQNTNIKTAVDAIINNHIPGTNAKVDVNLAAIDIIDGIVDSIKLKTDATPQNVRGNYNRATLSTSSGTLVEVVNASGNGILHSISCKLDNAGDTLELQLSIGGGATIVLTHTGDTNVHPVVLLPTCMPGAGSIQAINETDVRNKLFNFEFETRLLVELKRSAGTADNVRAEVYYSLDTF